MTDNQENKLPSDISEWRAENKEMQEVISKMLEGVRAFKYCYPVFEALSEGNFEIGNLSEFNYQLQIANNVFNVESFDRLRELNGEAKRQFTHDLNNTVTSSAIAHWDMFSENWIKWIGGATFRSGKASGSDSEILREKISDCSKFLVTHGLVYQSVIEDILLRESNQPELYDKHLEKMDKNNNKFQNSFLVLQEVFSRKKIIPEKVEDDIKPFSEMLREGECLETNPSIIINGVFNIISNAVKKEIDAQAISLDMDRDDGHIVIRISDAGIGMSSNKLVLGHKDCILEGHSHTGGGGLGLAGILDRLKQNGVSFRIWSRERGTESFNFLGQDKDGQLEENLLSPQKTSLLEVGTKKEIPVSTVFEFLIPIKKQPK